MIKHIVVWKLKDEAHGNKKEINAGIIKEKLESLNRKIDGLIKLEVGFDFSQTADSFDLVLYSEFKTKKDLADYQIHPLHQEIVPFIREAKSERRLIDYEI